MRVRHAARLSLLSPARVFTLAMADATRGQRRWPRQSSTVRPTSGGHGTLTVLSHRGDVPRHATHGRYAPCDRWRWVSDSTRITCGLPPGEGVPFDISTIAQNL